MAIEFPKPFSAISVFNQHQVEYIVVGAVAAVLQGAPITTYDLDVVHSRTPENIQRLLLALTNLQARYRDLTGCHLPANAGLLAATPGHNLFKTRYGSVDVLATVGAGRDYDSLFPDSFEMDIEGMRVRVLELFAVIALKEAAGRDKDKWVLPILKQALLLRNKQ